MSVLFFGVFATFPALAFGPTPIRAEVLRGEAIERKGKGIERTLLDDRSVVGYWSDGWRKKGVEDAIWLSPPMVSRWLGYLQAREGWTDDELQSRWDRARQFLDGKMTFVVRLASLPKIDPLWDANGAPGDPREVEEVHPVLTIERGVGLVGWHQTLDATALVRSQAWTPGEVLGVEWSKHGPLKEFLGDRFGDPAPMDYPTGECVSVVWLVQGQAPQRLWGQSKVELRVVTPKKERRAEFQVGKRRKV